MVMLVCEYQVGDRVVYASVSSTQRAWDEGPESIRDLMRRDVRDRLAEALMEYGIHIDCSAMSVDVLHCTEPEEG